MKTNMTADTGSKNYEGYFVWISQDVTYYGSECKSAEHAARIADNLSKMLKKEFQNIGVFTYTGDGGGYCNVVGPDDEIASEISCWIAENLLSAF